MATVLGIDIGGTGIKAALVDTDEGKLVSDRRLIDTPDPSTPESVAATVKRLGLQKISFCIQDLS